MNDDPPACCRICENDVGEGETYCQACKDRAFADWFEHQAWLRMSDRERDDAIRRAY